MFERRGVVQVPPSSFWTFFFSAPVTSAGRPRRRVRLLGFFSSRCDRYCLRRNTRPVPVTLKRFAAPRCVFCFGISVVSAGSVGAGGSVLLGRRHVCGLRLSRSISH